jgi:AcrR family transcriptional regulator
LKAKPGCVVGVAAERLADGARPGRLGPSDGLRRERILRAMAGVAAERGYGGASVGLVVSRAGVSRRTFYRFFANREECFAAVQDMGLEWTVALVGAAFAGERDWRAGTRRALGWLLAHLDSGAAGWRGVAAESLGAGRWALEQREQIWRRCGRWCWRVSRESRCGERAAAGGGG